MKFAAAILPRGIEIKADGNQVLVPPWRPIPDTGTAYTWSVDSAAQIADAPEWLLAMAEQKRMAMAILPRRRQSNGRSWLGQGGRWPARCHGHKARLGTFFAGLLIRVWCWSS